MTPKLPEELQTDTQSISDGDERESLTIKPHPPAFEIVALTASAGGLKALRDILSKLPHNFPVPIVIVQHLAPKYRSFTAPILDRSSPLEVKQAQDGESLKAGQVYIAPPDYHLRVNPNHTLHLCQSAKVHFVRPAAEVLFQSIAIIYQHQAIAVVLTGADSDGQQGVQEIKKRGGVVIAQNRETSQIFGMPAAAIATGCVDWVLPLDKIAPALKNLVTTGDIKGGIL